jgi:hypothetical protein
MQRWLKISTAESRRAIIMAWVLAILAALIADLRAAEPEEKELPTMPQIIAVAKTEIGTWENYQAGDLITREQGKKLIGAIDKLGWSPANDNEMLAKMPEAKEALCELLLSDKGRPFMRQVLKMPLGIDRVDNLLKIPSGKALVKQLLNDKGGDQLIEYLTTSEGGKNMGKMLGKEAHVDFNKATGRLYTAKALLLEVEAQYQLDMKKLDRPVVNK